MNCPLAIVTPEFGVPLETFIRRHIELLLPRGTAVVTGRLSLSHDALVDSGVPVLELDRVRPAWILRGMRAAARRAGVRTEDHTISAARSFFGQHKVEVIMGEYLDSSLPWLNVARGLSLRFFAHAHGYDVSRRLDSPKWRTKYLRYNYADGVITMSRFSRDRLVALGLDPSKVHVIPYGVDVPAEPVAHPESKTIRCLAVGRMVGKKAPILALDAFRRAINAHPDLHFDFVGAGALFPAAQQFVRCFSLESRVTLHGEKRNEDVQRMMRDADLFIQHSITGADGNQEGLPVAILEAMAHSLPVVSTRHAGIPEAVEDGISGYLVKEGDSAAMADRIVQLARDPDLRHTLGSAGWQRAKERFSWEQERARLSELLGLGNLS